MKQLKWLMIPMSVCMLALASCDNEECGNGEIEELEQCDDNNDINNDGCTNVCTLPVCGDAIINQAQEECDDGNEVAGDGCENNCTVTIDAECGDGVVEGGEACDDGNQVDGDGCESDCTVTPGPACGDGNVDPGEGCDDGNLVDGDGCSAACQFESETVPFPVDPNPDLNIPDNGYDGTIASMACVDIEVPDNGYNTILNVQVQVAISHTFIGDLVIKLLNPANDTVLTMLSRPGLVEANDDGTGCCGDNSNLAGANPITFKNAEVIALAEDMGDIPVDPMDPMSVLGNNGVVCADDGVCEYFPVPGAGSGTDFSDFNGQSSVGTWKLCVGDSVADDAGTLEAVELTITKQFTP